MALAFRFAAASVQLNTLVETIEAAKRTSLRAKTRALVEHRVFQATIIAVIVLNAVVIGVQTYPSMSHSPVLLTIDVIVLAIFTIEIALRLFAYGGRFFRRGWN